MLLLLLLLLPLMLLLLLTDAIVDLSYMLSVWLIDSCLCDLYSL